MSIPIPTMLHAFAMILGFILLLVAAIISTKKKNNQWL
ncbi:MAG: LPXTG cell wall anchor domain-containing protein [Spirochaetes bacterium]|nr:LPXTG cell wall anchor domain-containing protein [Spirochaetota bacterium]